MWSHGALKAPPDVCLAGERQGKIAAVCASNTALLFLVRGGIGSASGVARERHSRFVAWALVASCHHCDVHG